MKLIQLLNLYLFFLICLTLAVLNSCKKDDIKYGENVIDIDGNKYTTIIIGNQEWMAENLRTTKYNDGTDIPTGHTDEEWSNLSSGAFAIYAHSKVDDLSNDAEVVKAYGILYNWYAVDTDILCPIGWQVPTEEDWANLTDFVTTQTFWGVNNAGGKLKSTRTEPDKHPRWESPNVSATDKYGFSAFPAGRRSDNGGFGGINRFGFWWSSTRSGAVSASIRYIESKYVSFSDLTDNMGVGLSIRCMKK